MIERLAGRLGLPKPALSREQWQLPLVRRVVMLASAVGISIGCLLGMFPLLFTDQESSDLKSIFDQLDEDGDGYVSYKELDKAV